MKQLFVYLFAFIALGIFILTSCKKEPTPDYSGVYSGQLTDANTGYAGIPDNMTVSKGGTTSTINVLDNNSGENIVFTLGPSIVSGGTTNTSISVNNAILKVGGATSLYSGTGSLTSVTGNSITITTLAFTLTDTGGDAYSFSGTN